VLLQRGQTARMLRRFSGETGAGAPQRRTSSHGIASPRVWIPKRFHDTELKGLTNPKFQSTLLKRLRWFEKFSRPRMAGLLENRLTGVVFGAAVFGFTLTAFLAPPFSGLDTLPSLGVVVLSLGVLLGDIVVAGVGIGIGAVGVALVVGLGNAITKLF
jgi:hypothetical protein